jgi:photosystem II stability/assembly factor-like uncharacterized protein
MRLAVVLALAVALAVAATAYGRGPAHGVPKGFHPETAAVVGTRDIWISGYYNVACGSVNPCRALVRSRDAGRHFTALAPPPLVGGGSPTLDFTSARTGYAFEPTGRLYVTHDGGNRWLPWSPANVTDVAIGGGEVYAVFTRYRRDEYGHFVPASWHVQHRSASGGTWHVVELPVRFRFPISVAARGRAVWLLGSTGNAPGLVTLRSTDRGRTFSQSNAFCAHNVPDEGGRLVPAGHGVVWAVCPTGDGDASRLSLSKDGGRTFRSFGISLRSGAGIFPSSAHAAVLSGAGASGYLLRTADMGRHWVDDRQTAPFWELYWLDFATRRVGAGLFTTFSHPNRASFWRTTDGGATWHSLPIR